MITEVVIVAPFGLPSLQNVPPGLPNQSTTGSAGFGSFPIPYRVEVVVREVWGRVAALIRPARYSRFARINTGTICLKKWHLHIKRF